MPLPDANERKNLQSLYPTAKARSGMDARQPTKFSIPIFTLAILLFIPIFIVIALIAISLYGDFNTKTAIAGSQVLFSAGIMVAAIIGIVMLAYARSIIVRNCAHPGLIQLVYVVVIIPLSFLLLFQYHHWYGEETIMNILRVEAIGVGALVLLLVMVARRLTR